MVMPVVNLILKYDSRIPILPDLEVEGVKLGTEMANLKRMYDQDLLEFKVSAILRQSFQWNDLITNGSWMTSLIDLRKALRDRTLTYDIMKDSHIAVFLISTITQLLSGDLEPCKCRLLDSIPEWDRVLENADIILEKYIWSNNYHHCMKHPLSISSRRWLCMQYDSYRKGSLSQGRLRKVQALPHWGERELERTSYSETEEEFEESGSRRWWTKFHRIRDDETRRVIVNDNWILQQRRGWSLLNANQKKALRSLFQWRDLEKHRFPEKTRVALIYTKRYDKVAMFRMFVRYLRFQLIRPEIDFLINVSELFRSNYLELNDPEKTSEWKEWEEMYYIARRFVPSWRNQHFDGRNMYLWCHFQLIKCLKGELSKRRLELLYKIPGFRKRVEKSLNGPKETLKAILKMRKGIR